MIRFRSWLLVLLAILIMGIGSLIVPVAYAKITGPQTAYHPLASCSGSHCNGADAYSSGCAGNNTSYWVVDSVPVTWQRVNYGWVQLWYSGTCGTNWARYACSTSCRGVSLTLYVCSSGIPVDSVQGPIFLTTTGRTKQQYLPTTPAAASVLFEISGPVFSGSDTGCY